MNWKKLAEQAGEAARNAGNLILSMERPKATEKEGHANFVTAADLASQEYLFSVLGQLFPEAAFIAEEQENPRLDEGFAWVVDPLDGTTNFMRGYRHSAVSIGLVRGNEAVLGAVWDPYGQELFLGVEGEGAFLNGSPIHVKETPAEQALIVFGSSPYYRELADETFSVVKTLFLSCGDVRRSGSAALDLCCLAAGRCDGFYEARLSPWDYAGASVILTEAGGRITSGREALSFAGPGPICAGSLKLHQLILDAAFPQ